MLLLLLLLRGQRHIALLLLMVCEHLIFIRLLLSRLLTSQLKRLLQEIRTVTLETCLLIAYLLQLLLEHCKLHVLTSICKQIING